MPSQLTDYRIADNFGGVNYFYGQADLGVVYWNACNAVQAMNILTHEHHRVRVERIFTPQKLPATFTWHAKDNILFGEHFELIPMS